MSSEDKQYDLFICHASEDKKDFVRPLAHALRNLGLTLWYDEFSLSLGDSLSSSIDRGLALSRFAVVVISPAFVEKSWPHRELAGLVAREIEEGSIILPVWHRVTRQEVASFSPPLADKLAVDTSNADAITVALQILQRVRPDLYMKHPREDLEQNAGEDFVAALQDEIDETRHELEETRLELSEFQCPVCGAKLVSANIVAYEEDGDYSLDYYECGYEATDGRMSCPCPYDANYPNPDDYKLSTYEAAGGGFLCLAHGKTHLAQRVSVPPGQGATPEEAEADIRGRLPRRRELRRGC